jgi:hypothetical protein
MQGRYVSWKTGHDFVEHGMSRAKYEDWCDRFCQAVSATDRTDRSWFCTALDKRLPLSIAITVSGVKRRGGALAQLDLDGVACQVFNEIVKYFYPGQKGKKKDQQFWKLLVAKEYVPTEEDEGLDVVVSAACEGV